MSVQADVDGAWHLFSSAVKAPKRFVTPADGSLPGLQDLCSAGLAELAVSRLMEGLRAELGTVALPAFWSTLSPLQDKSSAEDQPSGEELEAPLLKAVQALRGHVERQRGTLASVGSALAASSGICSDGAIRGLLARHERLLAGLLMASSHSLDLPGILCMYYKHKLGEFSDAVLEKAQKRLKAEAMDEGEDDESEEEEEDEEDKSLLSARPEEAAPRSVMGDAWVERVSAVAAALGAVGLGGVNENTASGVVCQHLQQHLSRAAKHRFEDRLLESAQDYARGVPLEFALLASSSQCSGAEQDTQQTQQRSEWLSLLSFLVYNSIAKLRIGEMFDIVVDYPESLPAIEDLRECLANTSNQRAFVSSFMQAIQTRLLHAGAATKDIIQQYVSTIKALRQLDPPGVLLEAVGQPIKEYLKRRKDTIRQIVTMLTDDSMDEDGAEGTGRETLFSELHREGGGVRMDDGSDADDGESDEAVLRSALRWEPDPVDADPSQSTASRRLADVISMLVGIYGSAELFINEYRIMLADKLIGKMDFDTSREIRTLELLKLRFGEANMHNCEIMLKDLADSKRISAAVKKVSHRKKLASGESPADLAPFGATIVSPLFWPPIKGEELKLPDEVQQMGETFADRYHSLKAPRKLVFGYQLGTAELEIEVGDATLQFTVSAAHASIILCFQDRKEWPASELAEAVGMPLLAFRRRVVYWLAKGVLTEVRRGDVVEAYRAAEKYGADQGRGGPGGRGPGGAHAGGVDPDDAGRSSAVASAEEQMAEEMKVYESFVVGMLTNHSEMPLDKIHNMLKMFAPGFDKSADQLAAFMMTMVREEKIAMEGGVYRKKPS